MECSSREANLGLEIWLKSTLCLYIADTHMHTQMYNDIYIYNYIYICIYIFICVCTDRDGCLAPSQQVQVSTRSKTGKESEAAKPAKPARPAKLHTAMEYRWRSLLVELTQVRICFADDWFNPDIYLKPFKGEFEQLQNQLVKMWMFFGI